MNVLFTSEVLAYFEDLVIILYEKEYFVFLDSAERYVEELVYDIKMNLPTKLHRPAPDYFDKYGKNMEYAIFRKNKQTTWYVFFRVYQKYGEDIYQIRYIANNHTIAQYFDFFNF